MEDSILNFLNYEGLEYYDGKSEERTDKKIAVETERAKTVESTLTTNLNNEISRAKKAEENNATSIDNEVTRATNAENTLATNLSSHTSNKSNPHGVTKAQVGLGNVDNTSDANKPISTATQTALNAKAPLASPTLTGTPKAPTATAGTNTTQIATTAFVQTAVSNLVDSAPETLNTLNELSAALGDDPNFATTIATQLGNKVDKVSGKDLSTNDYTTTEKTKLSGIATGAEVNQNAFSNVVVGTTTISADSKTDSLTLAGSNVTLTPDATNDKLTIGITKENVTTALGYTPPTTNTTYGVATSSALGLVKSGTDITIDSSGNVSVNDDSHNHTIANVDGLQTALDGKAATSHGTHVTYGTSASALGTSSAGSATTVSRSDHVHALPALTSCTGTLTVAKGGTGATTAAGALTNLGLTATAAELNYCDGVTSNIQTQLGNKLNSSSVTTSLASTSTTTALASSAGKNLQDQITSLNSDLNNKMDRKLLWYGHEGEFTKDSGKTVPNITDYEYLILVTSHNFLLFGKRFTKREIYDSDYIISFAGSSCLWNNSSWDDASTIGVLGVYADSGWCWCHELYERNHVSNVIYRDISIVEIWGIIS